MYNGELDAKQTFRL